MFLCTATSGFNITSTTTCWAVSEVLALHYWLLDSFLGNSLWFWTPSEQLRATGSKVCRSSVNCDSTLSLPFIFCILSKQSVSVPPPPFPHVHLHTRLFSQPVYWHKINTVRTLIKCNLQLLTFQQDKATCGPNPAHVKEVNKSTWNKSSRNRNALKFYLVLSFLGKFNKVNCPSVIRKNKLYWSHLEQSATVIYEAESRVQQCLSIAGEGAGTALCAWSWHVHIRKSSTH